MLKVEEIHNSLLNSASYIISNGETVVLIDCGDIDKLIDRLNNSVPNAILLTHCHFDHIYGLQQLIEIYPETNIYCSEYTFNGLKDYRQNLSYIFKDIPFEFDPKGNFNFIVEGSFFIGSMKIESLYTPGHSSDCMTYKIEDCIFTGDSHIPFAKVFTKWPFSNKLKATESEKRIIDLVIEKQLKVYSGHWH